MRKFLGSIAVACLIVGPAFAADMAVRAPVYTKAPPPPAPVYSWDGWYIGGNAGYAFNNNNNVDTGGTNVFAFAGGGAPNLAAAITALSNFSAGVGKNGFIGGGQIGRNWQFSNTWVAGIEADIQGVSGKGSSSVASTLAVPGFPNSVVQAATVTNGIDYLGTLRGRLGILATPSLLLYGTGGLAYGGVSASTNVSQTLTGASAVAPPTWAGAGAFSDTRFGWAAGAGLEWMFAPNWTTKVEYLHYDLGSVNYGASPLVTNAAAASPFTINNLQSSARFNGDIVRAGLNYKF
jgi:outer membrane immunogenic protein